MKTCTRCRRSKPADAFWLDHRRGQRQSRCSECRTELHRAYREDNPDKRAQRDKNRYWNNRESERERHLVRKYGVSQRDYEAMFAAQKGVCAICQREVVGALNVDHDHKTQQVRGLLCNSCNRMLGHAHDSPSRLYAAVGYLERSLNTSTNERNGNPKVARIKVGARPATDTATPNGNGGGQFTLDLGAPPAAGAPTLDLGESFDLSGLDKKLGLTEQDVLNAAATVDTSKGPVPVDNSALFEALANISKRLDGTGNAVSSATAEILGALTGLSGNMGGLVDGLKVLAITVGEIEHKINTLTEGARARSVVLPAAPQGTIRREDPTEAPPLDDAVFSLLKRAHAQFSQQQAGKIVPFAALANALAPHAGGATPQDLAVGWRTLGYSLDQQGMVHF